MPTVESQAKVCPPQPHSETVADTPALSHPAAQIDNALPHVSQPQICAMQKSPSMARGFGDTHPVASIDTPNGRAQNRRVEMASAPEAPSNTFDRSQERKVKSSRLCSIAAVAGVSMLLSGVAAVAQQGPPGCNWKKYLYAQDAVQQGKLATNMLN